MRRSFLLTAGLITVVLLAAGIVRSQTTTPAATKAGGASAASAPAVPASPALTSPAAGQAVPAVMTVAKPTKAVAADSCVTSQCHADVKQYKVLHGPVNVNACDACHKVKSESEHTFELARETQDLCTFCHKMEIPANLVIHKPVQEKDCLGCHNPHGGTTSKSLRGKTLQDTCRRCHNDVVAQKQFIHGPVAAGACDACHEGHAAARPKLLRAAGRDLCLNCHTEMKQQLAQVKFPHKAVAEGECTNCHDPHASNFAMQVKMQPAQLCEQCHEKQKTEAEMAKYKHDPVTKGQACLNCHTPHGSDLAKLMKAQPMDTCMKCHVKRIDAGKGHVVQSVKEVLDPAMSKHGPIRDKNCAGCHNVHGSEVSRLLKKDYPETFYQGFALEKYDLCFSCHDKQLVLSEKANGLTNFRNGDMNLHYLHVNKADKGRNCRACHATHASKHDLHVRDSVPFGKWEMPINHNRTSTGGSCAPGCHRPFSYDREKPVDYDAILQQAPTTAPTLPAANSLAETKEGKS